MPDYGPHNPIRVITATVDLASVATITTAEQDITVAGVEATDELLNVIKPAVSAGLGIVGARVKAANTIALTLVNPTAGAINAASEAGWKFILLKV